MASTMVQVATACTTVNEQKTYAELPPGTKGYLQEKIEYALKAPDIVDIRLPDGSNTIALLKQLVMTAALRVDERLAKVLLAVQGRGQLRYVARPHYEWTA